MGNLRCNMSIITLSAALLLQTHVKVVKLPIFDFDHKTNSPLGTVPTRLPEGFTDPNPQSGKLLSKNGSISFSISKSGQPIPTPQRNPEAKKGEVWTTIRLVKWIGWRNVNGNQEFYKLNWTGYRVNAVLTGKTKTDIAALRKGLGVLCDNLTF